MFVTLWFLVMVTIVPPKTYALYEYPTEVSCQIVIDNVQYNKEAAKNLICLPRTIFIDWI